MKNWRDKHARIQSMRDTGGYYGLATAAKHKRRKWHGLKPPAMPWEDKFKDTRIAANRAERRNVKAELRAGI